MRFRRNTLLAALATTSLATVGCASAMERRATQGAADRRAAAVDVTVDQRIEILAIIFRLAGAAEFSAAGLPAYAAAVDSFFAGHRDHPAVRMARDIREQRQVAHDAVISLAVRATDFPLLAPRSPLAASDLERRWDPAEAERFLTLVADFARTSDAAVFFARHEPLYTAARQRMAELIRQRVDTAWASSFFGGAPGARFIVAVSPALGRFAYSAAYRAPGGHDEVYAAINIWQADSAGLPVFSPSNAPVILHEFAHGFVNPVVDDGMALIGSAADPVLDAVMPQMRSMGYTSVRTLVAESIIRAATARQAYARAGIDTARHALQVERLSGFLWIDDLFSLLGVYEQSRDRYPAFRDFFPEIAAYFRDLGPRIGGVVAAFDARRPQLLQMNPPNGSESVDPELRTITFRFDRPMRAGYSLMLGAGGREKYPNTPHVEWDEHRTTLTMHVELEPEREYEFWLNVPQSLGFMSAEGYPLNPYRVHFRTGLAQDSR